VRRNVEPRRLVGAEVADGFGVAATARTVFAAGCLCELDAVERVGEAAVASGFVPPRGLGCLDIVMILSGSRRTFAAPMSPRKPRNIGWRRIPESVHPAKQPPITNPVPDGT
jgi:hypothetical protein